MKISAVAPYLATALAVSMMYLEPY